jgi:hypothetical protein
VGLGAVTEDGEYATVGEWSGYWKWNGSEMWKIVEPMVQSPMQSPSESNVVLRM